MPGYFGQQIQQGVTPVIRDGELKFPVLRDFEHAAKTFLPNGYSLVPKFKFLFHVYFDINPQAYINSLDPNNNYGLAVKTVKLPSFNFKTETLNQYNRKRIVQTKIQYNPVNISFHDDNGNMMTSLWEAYYTYYYSDGTKIGGIFKGARGNSNASFYGNDNPVGSDAGYNTRNLYNDSITGNTNWGYRGEGPKDSKSKIPFFKNITIFGFNQHKFTAYTLINPIITSFSHDTYNYSEGGGTMEMSMDLDYETVVYNEGAIDGRTPDNIVRGFGVRETYDTDPSPITPPGVNTLVAQGGGYIPSSGGFVGPVNRRE